MTIPAAIALVFSLAACGNTNEGANEDNQGKQPLPMGYYSNEKHEESGGNANWLNEDNDGPMTEIMDHTISGEGKDPNMRGVNNQAAPDGRHGNTLFSRSDMNYHGHLNNNKGGARSSYYTAYDGELTKKINDAAGSVVNVADARTVVHKDKILIGVVLEDPQREKETIASIRDAVKTHLKGKALTIDTNESTYSRMKVIDNDLREGGPKDQLDQDIRNIFRSIRNDNQ